MKHTIEICLAVVLIALLLPLLAFALIVMRGVFLLLAMGGLAVSAVLYCTYPRFRHRVDQLGHPTPRLKVR